MQSQVWWLTPIIPAFERPRQKPCWVQAILGYIMNSRPDYTIARVPVSKIRTKWDKAENENAAVPPLSSSEPSSRPVRGWGAFNFLRKAKGNIVKAEMVAQTYHSSAQEAEAEKSTVGNQSGLCRDTCLWRGETKIIRAKLSAKVMLPNFHCSQGG